MYKNNLPILPPFSEIHQFIDTERATIIKGGFSEEENMVRSVDEAKVILDFIEELQRNILSFFEKSPSLITLFEKEFIETFDFFSRESVIEISFLDDFLFPEKKPMAFIRDNHPDPKLFKSILTFFEEWISEKESGHQSNQKLLKEEFHLELGESDLKCPCHGCLGDYRNKLRQAIFKESIDSINEEKISIQNELEKGIGSVSILYFGLQKKLDKTFFKFRKRIKKSTLNRLESQVKTEIKKSFYYPAPLAMEHSKNLQIFFEDLLRQQGLKRDLVGPNEYKRFFTQLGGNLWKGEIYLQREFKKLLNSVMLLKRKDISGKILQEYLGEFWIHSLARSQKRRIIYHAGPTNSGKTYFAVQKLCQSKQGCYLAPLRLLAAELYDTMNSKSVVTTLLTGEEVIEVENATHFSSTIEMAKFDQSFDCCVIDEIQMISDSQRGWAWTRALVNIMADEIHLCGDPSVLDLIKTIVDLCGDTLEVKYYERMAELSVSPTAFRIGELKKHDALIVFSRRNALRYKRDLERLGLSVSIVYGRLSPEVRREQARKFDHGETDIIVATDAISMGMNLPIKKIVFSTLSKFIDNQEHPLSNGDIKQIAGRAGRFQRFPKGEVSCLSLVDKGLEKIKKALDTPLAQKSACMVGPDLEIYNQVNNALKSHGLPILKLSEFLRLFNTMEFKKPFYCVDLKDMIDLSETVEEIDQNNYLSSSEIFGFACAPVNLGLLDHFQYYIWILNNYVKGTPISNEPVDHKANDIDYLETAIKCVELYQWLARHFNGKNFSFEEFEILENKGKAIERLNELLSKKTVPTCNSCGSKLPDNSKFAICEDCFAQRKKFRGVRRPMKKPYIRRKKGKKE